MATRPRLVGLPLEPVLAIRPACCSAGLSDRCGTRTTAQPAGSSPPTRPVPVGGLRRFSLSSSLVIDRPRRVG